MKLRHKIKPNTILAYVLLVLFALNCLASYQSDIFVFKDVDVLISKITTLITTTILLTFYFAQKNRMATVFFTIFLLFFIGDALAVFNLVDISLKLAEAAYLCAYLLIIFVLFGQLKRIKFDGIVSIYLILVLLLNSYFLYVLYGVVKENFVDDLNLGLYIFNGVALIAMCFFAFAVYLNKETSQSITYLLMVFCFVFSDVLKYICDLYVYYWLFELFERMLHLIALYLLYRYVFEHHTASEHKEQKVTLTEYFIPTTAKLKEIRVNL
ncbi:hypothetical protein [Aquaticitalea lipolytica]|uniref:hypothetical protein n=1 Tax=Aquaticitalea lipolytica TaxID=1247562 RepID=UPI0024B94D8D|nr:hypothetical protein [Aquaticitalea lipolytica]